MFTITFTFTDWPQSRHSAGARGPGRERGRWDESGNYFSCWVHSGNVQPHYTECHHPVPTHRGLLNMMMLLLS